MDFEDAFGIGEEAFSTAGEANPAAASMKQTLAESVFQPLYLHGHGRLRTPDLYSRRAEGARMRRTDEGGQQPEIEWSLHINSADI